MNNPLLDSLMGSQRVARPSNPLALISQFRKFAANMTPEKAEEEVMRLLSSGQMTREQFAELKDTAGWLMQFLK